jgi:uncharacterized protein with HEPN domain
LPDCETELFTTCFGLDLEIIWQIIQHDLPELEKQVRPL